MILVDIYVPSVDKEYDFRLDETAKVRVVIDEIVEMINQLEKTTLYSRHASLSLYDKLEKRPLPFEPTLEQCGIHNGSSMILV